MNFFRQDIPKDVRDWIKTFNLKHNGNYYAKVNNTNLSIEVYDCETKIHLYSVSWNYLECCKI